MPVPNTFANATATIPLSQLDANFATTITLGNTAIQLGNTVSTLNDMTLANVTVTSGNVTITNVTVTTANVTTANIATAEIANVTVSGTGTFAAGSNTAPSITTSGDTNTGIFYPAADTVAIGTGGTERLRVDSAGNAGLGVTPSAWGSGFRRAVQVGTGAALSGVASGASDYFALTGNAYLDSGPTYRYISSTTATRYEASAAEHRWFNAASGTAGNAITFTQSMTLDASGNLALGDTTSSGYRLKVVTSSGFEDVAYFASTGTNLQARLNLAPTGTGLGSINATANGLALQVSGTERARITSGGDFLVGKTASGNAAGCELRATGEGYFVRSGADPMSINRLTNDGILVGLYQDTILEGNISVSGNTVSYNPFLGSHAGAFADWSRPEVKIGTIFETINELIDYKVVAIEVEDVPKRISYNGNGAVGTTATVEYEGQEYTGIIENERGQLRDFNKHVKVKINDTPDSKAVYGVFVGWNTDPSNDGGVYNDMLIGAVGNYVIRMASGQTPEIGDLVKADGTGCAIVQEDDIVRTKTVGKITNTIPQLTYEDGSFLVACVLYCG